MFPAPLTVTRLAETDPERVSRHLAMLRELAELGMGLARTAAADATREAEADSAAIGPAGAAPRRGARTAFVRLSQGVRQTIALERRVAARAPEPVTAERDPRRGIIWGPLRDLAEAEWGAQGFGARRGEVAERLVEALDADPDWTQAPEAITRAVAGRLGIEADAKRPRTLRAGATGPP